MKYSCPSVNLWTEKLKNENKKTAVLIGCEPTGHYWFAFATKPKVPDTININNNNNYYRY